MGSLGRLSATGESVLNSQVGKDGKLWTWCSSFSMDLSDDIKLKSFFFVNSIGFGSATSSRCFVDVPKGVS